MKHNILPESWCVARNNKAQDFLESLFPEVYFRLHHEKYFGIVNENGGKLRFRNEPFGQLLTEEQFLYCIGEPVEGEEIEVSNVGFVNNIKAKAFLLKIEKDVAWVVVETDDNTAKWWVDYRRKHLVLEVDKWAKEKQAFAEGKTIQSRDITGDNDWVIAELPKWHSWKDYRIKPEPKYAPFTREDWDLFKMKEVRNNPDNGVVVVIISCDNDGVRCGRVECTYESAFDSIVFADGTPFGKLIEE